LKASTIVIEEIDEMGRYISPVEFRWLMDYFKDRYDPRRLSFALGHTTGLRTHDYVRARIAWFSQDFREMKMSQCKAHIRKKDGVVHARVKPKCVPIPEWLAKDLRNYCAYRLAVGVYVGKDIEDGRLFPKLEKVHLRGWLAKLRKRYGEKQSWLLDVWQREKRYGPNGELINIKNWYRIACHACRANYDTAAWEVTNHDIMATKAVTSRTDTKALQRYVRITGLTEKREEIKKRFMEPLLSKQEVPLLTGQRKLDDY